MDRTGPTMNAAYRLYAGLLLRHQQLLRAGQDDRETEEIEEQMSVLWGQLDEAQRRSLKGIGSDLNWARSGGLQAPKARRLDESSEEERSQLAAAEATGDWHAVLHLLRLCAPALGTADLARRRAAAYRGAGLPQFAEAVEAMLAGQEASRASA